MWVINGHRQIASEASDGAFTLISTETINKKASVGSNL